jgi:Na+/proline symporter
VRVPKSVCRADLVPVVIRIVSCPGLFPLLLTAFWRKQSKLAITASTLAGVVFGLATWLGLAYKYSGNVTIDSTQGIQSCL